MKKKKELYIQAGAVAGTAAVLVLVGLAQQRCIGQNYFEIIVDNKVVGATGQKTDEKEMLNTCRRELNELTDGYVCLDADIEIRKARTFGTRLLTKTEAEQCVLEELKHKVVTEGTSAYTVNIGEFTASFPTLEDVGEFLSTVKQPYDAEGKFSVVYEADSDHSVETFEAKLAEASGNAGAAGNGETESSASPLLAGAVRGDADRMAYACAHPGEKNYETGLVDLGFAETVTVYADYVNQSELTTPAAASEAVTKEEETNKIYEVQAGDCLSTIAEDNHTTVAQIMALNGFADTNAYICIGDEIVISVPEPDLSVWETQGVVYEEDYTADPTIVGNDSWYTTKQVTLQEGTTGHREVNMFVTYKDGVETGRSMAHQTILAQSEPAVIEQGTQIPPTYVKPLSGGRFTSGFGKRWGRMHKGVDWACPTGTTVYASSDGVVEYADWSNGYGYNVIIDHPDGRKTRYCHLSKTLVTAGTSVSQGDPIAQSGSTGHSTGPHVHFEIFIGGTQVDPLQYIN